MQDYEAHDALALAERVARKDVSAEELLEAALERAAARNPALNAIVQPMLDEARATLTAGLPDGPLAGVPYLLKDLHCGYTGTVTTNGCRMFAAARAERDTERVARYRRAGLVIFGKTASPEFGLTPSTDSRLFGPTRNPWDLERTPGGSSGGSAAAVAAGILPAADASDGGGSIRIPAACCALFGLKPTRARGPAGPFVGGGWSGMSTAHAVTRSVRDSAALLDATRGEDLGAPYFAPPVERPYLDEVARPPGRLRIALQTASFNGVEPHADCVAAVEASGRLLESLGHDVSEARLALRDPDALTAAGGIITSANLRATLDARAAELGRALREDDVEPITWRMAVRGAEATAADYASAVRTIHGVGREVAGFFADHDLLVTPTMALPPQSVDAQSLSREDIGAWLQAVRASIAYTQLFNASGNPAASLPLHWNEAGLPIGVQITAPFGDEAALFRISAQLEQAAPWFDRVPAPLPTA